MLFKIRNHDSPPIAIRRDPDSRVRARGKGTGEEVARALLERAGFRRDDASPEYVIPTTAKDTDSVIAGQAMRMLTVAGYRVDLADDLLDARHHPAVQALVILRTQATAITLPDTRPLAGTDADRLRALLDVVTYPEIGVIDSLAYLTHTLRAGSEWGFGGTEVRLRALLDHLVQAIALARDIRGELDLNPGLPTARARTRATTHGTRQGPTGQIPSTATHGTTTAAGKARPSR